MTDPFDHGGFARKLVRDEAVMRARGTLAEGGRLDARAHWEIAQLVAGFMPLAMVDAGWAGSYEQFALQWERDFGPEVHGIALSLFLAARGWQYHSDHDPDTVFGALHHAIDAAEALFWSRRADCDE